MADFNLTLEQDGELRTPSEENWLLAVICSHNAFCSCGCWWEHLRSLSPSLRAPTRSQGCGTTDGDGGAGDGGGRDAGDGGDADDALLADALREAEEDAASAEG